MGLPRELSSSEVAGGLVQRFFFTIRGPDRLVGDDPHSADLPNVKAALSYAECRVRELRKRIGGDNPSLMMIVHDHARHPVLFVPFFPGS
jgi:hypothetical protein